MKPLRRSLDELEADIRAWARLPPDELLPLIAITRAAVAWRDVHVNITQSTFAAESALLDALRDAEL